MADRAQRFDNHKRYFPLFHFIAFPLLALYTLYALYALARAPSLGTAAGVVLGAGALCGLFAARIMALAVQNRVIRLEMQLRFDRVLGAAAHDAFAALRLRQIIALRFASDAELPALVARARANELPTGTSVKQAIREWQPDLLRA
jgi:multisubunit Na+/H+ antiporter MnhB subunit